MFFQWKKSLSCFGLVAGLVLLVGCQSAAQRAAPASHEMASDAVACDKCEVTWVKSPTANDKGRVIGYTTKKQMACPDCKAALTNFFATGNLKHECKACGGNMAVCEKTH